MLEKCVLFKVSGSQAMNTCYPENLQSLKLKGYTQPVGLGRPAYLHACLPGPYGNNS